MVLENLENTFVSEYNDWAKLKPRDEQLDAVNLDFFSKLVFKT